MNFSKKNPYIKKDGKPKSGFLHLAIDFEKKEEDKRRQTLSIMEQKKLTESDVNFSNKMQSSIN